MIQLIRPTFPLESLIFDIPTGATPEFQYSTEHPNQYPGLYWTLCSILTQYNSCVCLELISLTKDWTIKLVTMQLVYKVMKSSQYECQWAIHNEALSIICYSGKHFFCIFTWTWHQRTPKLSKISTGKGNKGPPHIYLYRHRQPMEKDALSELCFHITEF